MKKLLEGIRVLDLTQAYSGPFCCMHLADHGAEVIKIEPPFGDQTRAWSPIVNGYSGYYAYFNRNKRGLVLDLKTEAGKEALRRLIAKSDVVVENFKAGTFAKLGFTYESMKAIKPDIIYAQLTGFGLSGPMSSRPAYDIVAQAESGMMSMNGYAENPPVKICPAIADSYAGTYLSLGILMALFNRMRTGEGCHVDVAMLDTMFSVMEAYVVEHTLAGKHPHRLGNKGSALAPWDMFHAKNGFFVSGCGTDRQWQNFAAALGLDDLGASPDYATMSQRLARADYLKERIEAVTAAMSLDEVEQALLGAGVPFGRVNTLDDAVDLEQIRERNMLWKIYDPGLGTELTMPGTPIKFSNEDDSITRAAPTLGQDSEAVLAEIAGYSAEEIREMKQTGATR